MLIDTHAHVYATEFEPDRDAMRERALRAGVSRIVLPNIDEESVAPMMELVRAHPEFYAPAMGLHPCSVQAETYEQILDSLKKHLQPNHPFVAIGETGLDLFWDKSTLDIQIKALEIQCEWALEHDLPIIIHSRDATTACTDVLEPFIHRGLRGVFHCFSGSVAEAQRIVDLGFYLGIGGVITFKKTNLHEIVNAVPTASLLLETDAPYLAPVPYRGKRNESSYLAYVLDALSQSLMLGKKEVSEITTQNAKRLFKLR